MNLIHLKVTDGSFLTPYCFGKYYRHQVCDNKRQLGVLSGNLAHHCVCHWDLLSFKIGLKENVGVRCRASLCGSNPKDKFNGIIHTIKRIIVHQTLLGRVSKASKNSFLDKRVVIEAEVESIVSIVAI